MLANIPRQRDLLGAYQPHAFMLKIVAEYHRTEFWSDAFPCIRAVLCNNEVHMNDQHWHDVLAGYGKMSMLAEFASLQMEFKTLSHLTQDPKYALKADNMIKPLDAAFQDVVRFSSHSFAGMTFCVKLTVRAALSISVAGESFHR